jgi:transposase
MPCACSCARGASGVICRTTSLRGLRSTSKRSAGSRPGASRPWRTICALLRVAAERDVTPSAVVLDSRTLQSSPESGHRAGYDGAKRKRGSKVHIAVDTLGHLLALHVTPATEQDRAQVATLAEAVQVVTGNTVELAYVDQGYTGETAATAAAEHGLRLEVIKLPEARRGFVLLPRRWVVERSFAWMARFRRLARDYERSATTLAGLHYVAFACLMLHRAFDHA